MGGLGLVNMRGGTLAEWSCAVPSTSESTTVKSKRERGKREDDSDETKRDVLVVLVVLVRSTTRHMGCRTIHRPAQPLTACALTLTPRARAAIRQRSRPWRGWHSRDRPMIAPHWSARARWRLHYASIGLKTCRCFELALLGPGHECCVCYWTSAV